MLTEDWETRLQEWFDQNKYTRHTSGIFILEEEKNKPDNYAKVEFELKTGQIIYFKGENMRLTFLKNQKVADAIIFHITDIKTDLHIVECKTTVKSGEWLHIKEQFKGGFLTAIALQSLLKLPAIAKIYFYTAYRNDKKLTADLRDTQSIDWLDDKVNIFSLKQIPHQKIKLDDKGEAGNSISLQ